MVSYIKSDLEFILDQIRIAEAHADGTPLIDLVPNVQVPFGLRTVDGSFNNLVTGQDAFGAADNAFPRLLDPDFINAQYASSNSVVDPEPRIISNLIADQTANNPAAVAANGGNPTIVSPGLDGIFGTADDVDVFFIPNSTPDAGLSAPFNAWMTFFGQFFDHGLDLATKSSTEIIFIPLQADDPLFVPGSPTNFMVVSRTAQVNGPGADGILGTADDTTHEAENTTSPFVDQNQTYSSHPSHQVFLRAYEANADGAPLATGGLITNRNLGADGEFGTADDTELGGMATWAVLKAQAQDVLGINLTDADVFNVPLLATDAYGNFIKGPNGFPQVVMTDGSLVEGNPAAPIDLTNAVRTGHQFLSDIAHTAVPFDTNGNALVADADNVAGGPVAAGQYDDELLDAHYMAGDGRVNENIGLTAVHAIFHSEHNRLVEHTKEVALASGDLGLLNEWLLTPVAAIPTTQAGIAALEWNGERLFQAAKFGTEMQYQHLAFEEFARTIQPNVDPFLAPNGYDTTIDASIVAEFAHTVYRFGHSMLTETVDRYDADFNVVGGDQQIGLIAAFLNPLAYAASGLTPEEATGAIVRGVTRQGGNEIDEFVTEALRNNLVGLPLDLPAINIARGRDTGIPSLNEARREFFEMTGDSQLKAYTSWADLTHNLKQAESVINFIAAYGTHAALQAADVDTLAEMRDVALALVFGGSAIINAGGVGGVERLFTADEVDRLDFLNSTGIYANLANGATTTGVDDIDFWIGGLAEKQMPFGGLLGSTFNFVFETQLEALQDGDRFYYLSRTAGMHFGTELEQNSFAKLIMANSDATHLPSLVFQTPNFILEVDQSRQFTGLGADGSDDPTGGIFIGDTEVTPLVIRDNPATAGADSNYLQYTGGDHVVLGGTDGNDILIAGDGDDTVYGDGGNDRIEGGYGNDTLIGGDGDDIIQDMGGDDKLDGGAGHDVIQAGNMAVGGAGNLIFGGTGNDFIITTEDFSTTFAGEGDDFILGAKTNLPASGNEGDDWIERGTQDGAPGDNLSPLLNDGVIGNDIFIGGGGFDEMIGEGGDDIFVGSDAQDKMEGMSGFDWVTYKNDRWGVTADLTLPALAQPHGDTPISNTGPVIAVGASPASILDRFDEVEGLSGSSHADILRGDDIDAVTILNHGGATGGALTNVGLIDGLQDLLGGAAGFATGNIILGGAGSDIIEGRGGDDLIDGDRALNVRISVRANADGTGPEIASFDSMEPMIPLMLNGTYTAGQLKAVREITDVDDHFDTAVFTGNLADYQWIVNDNGTLDTADDVVTITDTVVGRDGTDTLKHIERLQFNDQSWTLSGNNFDPLGQVAVSDDTPAVGQLLTASIAGVTDDDNVSATNPTGAITSPVSYIWQVDRLGDGIFEDIVLLEAGDLAFQSANGRSFSVTPDLAGLALRVKAIFQDANGVTETVFSPATGAVAAAPVAPPVVPVAGPETVEAGVGVNLIRSDLNFILDQIKIAEAQTAGADILDLIPNVRAALGLRTVDGSFNNLMPGQDHFGAGDNVFPRMSDPQFDPAENGTSYQQTNGLVIDSQPRTISNLIVDQTANNPAAYATAYDVGVDGVLHTADDVLKDGVREVVSPGLDGVFGTADDKTVFQFDNVAPDDGLSAPFNAWMTFFGQFFDHGLDLVTKGGSGTVFIPLQPDDPLYVEGSPTNFMVLTRATNQPGADGVLGTADDIHEHTNTTSPFVDQNQTYSSHPSHQVFLRAYEFNADGDPVTTGRLITNRDLGDDGVFGTADDVEIGGMATWEVVKAQARDILGINLTDLDYNNVPLLATDAYGNFIKGPNGFPLVVMKGVDGIGGTADDVLVEGDPASPISLANAVRTGHAFLDDIAHSAVPVGDHDGNPNTPNQALQADADDVAGGPVALGFYDNELLDAHYIAGDGRVNENIGLTAVHAVFHSEHNRLVEQVKDTVLHSNDMAFLTEWLAPGTAPATFPTTQAQIDALEWNGERLFQTAKFGTEMQYQHLVFEEFARVIQPNVDLFFAPTQVYDVDLDPSIVAEFAHTVYRFGHSMLTETVDRYDADFNTVGGDPQIGLIAAFLNPLAFAESGLTPEEAAGAIVRGVTRQAGNEIDEFVTEALRNNLVGLPLDLPAINIARGRDTGIPSFNEARRDFYEMTGDSQLKPYTSWADLVQNLKHPESLINFIAAYGTHETIVNADTLDGKRAAATALVLGGTGAPADRFDFLNGTGAWANTANGVTITGVDDIDFWIGGLAEEIMPFGGMLGSTFNFVFETQLEKLQDGDRFYYLERTAGLSFNAELESNSFAKLIMANTDATHLPGIVFTTPGYTLEVDQSKQFNGVLGSADPTNGTLLTPEVIRDNPDTAGPDSNYLEYTGDQHVVLGGTNPGSAVNPSGNDILIASEGDDTVWGDGGDDRIEGGAGNDQLRGGSGDDIITDSGGDDNIQGGDGNDVIHGGNGVNLLIGGFGSDFIITGEDGSEAIGGAGNDFILGSKANEQDMGNEGDDWIEGGTADGAPGDNFDPLGNDPVIGNDVYIGKGENDKFNGEGGDDIMVGSPGFGDRYIGGSGYDWATFKDDALGVTIDMTDRFFDQPPQPGSGASVLTRFDIVEGLSGSKFGDVLSGDNEDAASLRTAGATGSLLTNFALILGLEALLGDTITPADPDVAGSVPFFAGGNIILGGDGSDRIEGRGGDDRIDGDAWLNVRISVRDSNGAEINSFDSMEGRSTILPGDQKTLVQHMLDGDYNPGQLQIVREINYAPDADFDTAVFTGNRADYTIALNGVVQVGDFIVDGDDIVTVTDNVGTDGADTLTHIERLQFADEALVLDDSNNAPVGTFTIVGTPVEDVPLTISIAGVTDPDNVSSTPIGAITGPVSYFWQEELDPGTGIFTDILLFGAGEAERAHGTSFIPTEDQVGLLLRVRAVYKDENGVLEEVFSAPTAPVINVNNAPTGLPTISDTTPTQGSLLTASAAGISDLDGLTLAVFQFQWQQSDPLSPTGFTDIVGESASSFTPTQDQVGLLLRVVVTYLDDNGALETVQSVPTQVVANVNDAPEGVPVISDTSPTEGSLLTALTDSITDVDGVGTFSFQWQQSDLGGGVTFANIPGATSETFTPTQGQVNRQLQLVITYTDAQGTIETLVSAPTGVTGDLFVGNNAVNNFVGTGGEDNASGNGGNDVLSGLGGNDILNGGAGIDVILGGAENDLIAGGIGNDVLLGEAGNDIFNYLFGDGADNVDGGADTDTLNILGTAAANTLDVVFNGTALTTVEGGALTSVESVTADLLDGVDTLTYAGTTVGVTVNLAADTASGFTSIAGIENVTGGNGNDSLTGNAAANILSGGNGNDVLNGGLGADTLSGGGGIDTASYLGETDDMFVFLNGATGNTRRGSAAAAIEDTLTSIENAIGGLGNDTITANGNANTLDGGGGNDIITGGTGNDTLSGGLGNDTFRYTIGDGADTVDGGVGLDTLAILDTNATNTLDVLFNGTAITQVEGGTVTGIEAITADMLGVNDRLSYAGTTAGVTVNLGAGTASGFASIANIENVTGGSGADTLTGNALVNNLAGGAGNDNYFVGAGDTITEGAGGGADTVFASGNFTLGANVENLTYIGAGNFTGTGNGLDNVITGGAGADVLSGGGGVDRLIGGAGADSLNGGAGNDFFVFGPSDGAGADIITGGFDANAVGGQDLMDLTAFGINPLDFAAQVSIQDLGNDTLVTVDTSHIIFLLGVNGNGTNVITIDDFLL